MVGAGSHASALARLVRRALGMGAAVGVALVLVAWAAAGVIPGWEAPRQSVIRAQDTPDWHGVASLGEVAFMGALVLGAAVCPVAVALCLIRRPRAGGEDG